MVRKTIEDIQAYMNKIEDTLKSNPHAVIEIGNIPLSCLKDYELYFQNNSKYDFKETFYKESGDRNFNHARVHISVKGEEDN